MHLLNHYTDLTLTQDQEQAVRQLEDFLSQNNCPVFLLKGYAGSGKTTLLSGLISYLKEQKKTFQLMAPTGRAAKVIQQKTGHEANTIHRTIYSFQNLKEVPQKTSEDAPSFHYVYELSTYSVDPDHLFIIDEASLVSDAYSENEFFRFGSGYLLRDLISYSQVQNPESRIKILFVGDPAQLPPVGMNSSPALDATYLAKHFQLTSQEVELKEVKRQSSAAGILAMATALRRSITSETFNDFQLPLRQQDLIQLPVSRFMEYYAPLPEPKMLICYQNKTAQKLNRAIRKYRYPGQAQMQVGDRVIIAKNNPQLQLFNGEFAEIRAIGSRSESREVPIKNGEKVRLTWRHVELYRDDDTGGPRTCSAFFLENFLYAEEGLSPEEQKALYIDFKIRYNNQKNAPSLDEALLKDPYFNCLLLKFGYAVTCHKAQGGEWPHAFVFWDIGVKPGFDFYNDRQDASGKKNRTFFRWAYTAITRASKTLYCINPPHFSSLHSMQFIGAPAKQPAEQHVEKQEVQLSYEEVAPMLAQFQLREAPRSIQEHAVQRWYTLEKANIRMQAWERVGYEIRYYFYRGSETAALKYWVNGKDTFKDSFQKIPKGTNSEALYLDIQKLLAEALPIGIQTEKERSRAFQFEPALSEEKPFLKVLFDWLRTSFQDGEVITHVEHLQYCERYTIEKNGKQCQLDFSYDKAGFFGQVRPLEKKCQQPQISEAVRLLIHQLNESTYAPPRD